MIVTKDANSGHPVFLKTLNVFFQGIMLHKLNHIKGPYDILQSLLRVFLVFKIRIWYDKSIVNKHVPYGL